MSRDGGGDGEAMELTCPKTVDCEEPRSATCWLVFSIDYGGFRIEGLGQPSSALGPPAFKIVFCSEAIGGHGLTRGGGHFARPPNPRPLKLLRLVCSPLETRTDPSGDWRNEGQHKVNMEIARF